MKWGRVYITSACLWNVLVSSQHSSNNPKQALALSLVTFDKLNHQGGAGKSPDLASKSPRCWHTSINQALVCTWASYNKQNSPPAAFCEASSHVWKKRHPLFLLWFTYVCTSPTSGSEHKVNHFWSSGMQTQMTESNPLTFRLDKTMRCCSFHFSNVVWRLRWASCSCSLSGNIQMLYSGLLLLPYNWIICSHGQEGAPFSAITLCSLCSSHSLLSHKVDDRCEPLWRAHRHPALCCQAPLLPYALYSVCVCV